MQDIINEVSMLSKGDFELNQLQSFKQKDPSARKVIGRNFKDAVQNKKIPNVISLGKTSDNHQWYRNL